MPGSGTRPGDAGWLGQPRSCPGAGRRLWALAEPTLALDSETVPLLRPGGHCLPPLVVLALGHLGSRVQLCWGLWFEMPSPTCLVRAELQAEGLEHQPTARKATFR